MAVLLCWCPVTGHLSEFLTDRNLSVPGVQEHSVLYNIIYDSIVFETNAVYTGDALG